MNKMFKSEVLDYTSKKKHSVSFFEDDSIEIVRQQISKSVDVHPDRLFILVILHVKSDYYKKDRRRWESLFERLSYNSEPLEKESFQEYQLVYRSPNTSVAFSPMDKTEWMSIPESLQTLYEPESDFNEYRILGVEEKYSYVLPLSSTNPHVSHIPATRLPVPQNTSLFSSFYSIKDIKGFVVLPYTDTFESSTLAYYPLLRANTPSRLTDETINLLTKNSTLLGKILDLKAPEPEVVSIIRTRFYIPWVETDFGSAIRTRFEQILYGLTVSKKTPYIGLFTSKDQVSRHKFYVEDSNDKKPFLEMPMWNTWWNLTKPSRNKPTLLLYRGKSKHHFDRIAITSVDMVLSTHRPEGNTESLEDLKTQMSEWISTLDGIVPFLDPLDIEVEKWELQDMSYVAKYSSKLEDFDLLRFNCISNIFDISDKTKSQFSLLRTDHENDGLSAVEVKILSMMKEGSITSEKVSEELSISISDARNLILDVETRLEEEPRLGQKSFRGYPNLRVGPDFVIVSSINELSLSLKYTNLLRYILSNPDSSDIDTICPKRMERVVADTSVVPTTNLEIDSALAEEYSDLFGYLEQEEDIKEETISIAESTETTQRISTDQKQGTIYNYFKNRLQQFDPETFDPSGSQYPKKCEQKHQPIILSTSDQRRVSNTSYDPSTYAKDDQLVKLENPDGTVVCPEYWCMRDQIPLQESQLIIEGDILKCPVCKGKLQTRSSDDPREFPLVKRETGFVFPGFVDYKSPKNQKPMPCCFKKSRAKKNEKTEKENEDKYYILGETKSSLKQGRIAFLSKSLVTSLQIKEKYEGLEGSTRRLQGGMSGFFRVGLGNPSESLASFLKLKTKIPLPRESIDTVLKCSFLRTWKYPGTSHLESITNSLKKFPEHSEDLARLISGIDEAYEKKSLSQLEELEYSALALQCDVFRIHMATNTLGCMFYVPIVRPRKRGIIILQNNDELDILSHATRLSRGFEFNANVFENPFKKETYVELETLRNESCKTEIPSYVDALNVMKEIEVDDYSIILDPYGRGQGFYVPAKLILPFQSSIIPDVSQSKLSGYKDIQSLPSYQDTLDLLEKAKKISKGFAYKEDLYNSNQQKVEILLESGLRIPIQPIKIEKQEESSEVIESLNTIGEQKLVFGSPSESLKNSQKEISYFSEVYEFLLFQLTKDLESDYKQLRLSLQEISPNRTEVEPELQEWFNITIQFIDIKHPSAFITKIRTPCGQFTSESTCSGNLCGWDESNGKCRIQIKNSLKKETLFHRILSSLLENTKIRSMVLDGRSTPFFSTILYLELPHELIVTDMELPA